MKKILTVLCCLMLISACRGRRGYEGPQGPKGDQGGSCSVSQAVNGAIITCQDGTSVVVLNGEDGQDGVNGTLVEVLSPCGNLGPYHEVLLKLSNGALIALFDGGPQLDRLVLLTAGSYRTTDGFSCNFTVDANGNIN